MNAIILGCGPAGLLAAEACYKMGVKFDIFSLKRKSPIFGAQFLHEPIPGMTIEPTLVSFHKVGTKQGYAEKVYGDPNAECSWDSYKEGVRPGWSLIEIYHDLWEKFFDKITDIRITPAVLSSLEEREADLMFSAIPLRELCRDKQHKFPYKRIWVERYAVGLDIGDNAVVYNGLPTDHWYRTSRLFGHTSTEYAAKRTSDCEVGVKPLSNNCDCRQKWKRIGRFGRWQRGVLTHHAYHQAQMAIREAM